MNQKFSRLAGALFLSCILAAATLPAQPQTQPPQPPYPIPHTGQTQCFDSQGPIAAPRPGEKFHGQDGNRVKNPMQYRDNGDGTITDLVTGLMWQKAHNQRMTFDDFLTNAAACRTGGHADWRAPTIKELFSLMDYSGYCGFSAETTRPFLNPVFQFTFGSGGNGERHIDCQYWSSNAYADPANKIVFGVNFADGRIKGYPRVKGQAVDGGARSESANAPRFRPAPGAPPRQPNMLYSRYVRGNPSYGRNDFTDNRDGTITDRATGLMWARDDSLKGMDWQEALACAARCKLAGHSDWRLPTAKELQSIVDYTRSPATTSSPAIDPLFKCSRIKDGEKRDTTPYYWTTTTLVYNMARDARDNSLPRLRGAEAIYVTFGKAQGYFEPGRGKMGPKGGGGFEKGGKGKFGAVMQKGAKGSKGRSASDGRAPLVDIHGAGAVRSDPKAGDPSDYASGRGPQGDEVFLLNYVRPVRDIEPENRVGLD